MAVLFYVMGALALVSTAIALTRAVAVHGLLFLVVSFLSIAVILYLLGAPFIAALEVVIYAGAVMVLFLFMVMLLPARRREIQEERGWIKLGRWIGPAALALILAFELGSMLGGGAHWTAIREVTSKEVGVALYTRYLIGTELASFLLLAGLVGAYHLGKRLPGSGGGSLK